MDDDREEERELLPINFLVDEVNGIIHDGYEQTRKRHVLYHYHQDGVPGQDCIYKEVRSERHRGGENIIGHSLGGLDMRVVPSLVVIKCVRLYPLRLKIICSLLPVYSLLTIIYMYSRHTIYVILLQYRNL